MSSVHLAVDIGASSGRLIAGWVENGIFSTKEIYRFPNSIAEKDGMLCWNIDALFEHILNGLCQCKEQNLIPVTLGIDTWGVDYVLLDSSGQRIGPAVSYRDHRTDLLPGQTDGVLPPDFLYAQTGIQRQSYNTLYQLLADRKRLKRAARFLMIPDYLNFLLTGHAVNEYTNATTTGLINANSRDWDKQIINALHFPEQLFSSPPLQPGRAIGHLRREISQKIGFNCTVILPATHDTGSAFLAIPKETKRSVRISSGTWSLIGVENNRPFTDEVSRKANFTNEGGYGGTYRFLKNITGLWMIQFLRRECNIPEFDEFMYLARENSDFPSTVDVTSEKFLSPYSMMMAIQSACEQTDQKPPADIGQAAACVYHSISHNYASAVRELSDILGEPFSVLNINGGGSRDEYLCTLSAKETGLTVHAGPSEGTALGNLMVQLIYSGECADISAARELLSNSFSITEYKP